MSLRNKKNLVVVVGVVAALLAGTVLLGGYAKFAPARSDSAVESKACLGTAGAACGGCPMTQALLAEDAQGSNSGQVMAALSVESPEDNPESCPAGRTEPCCAEDPPEDCCGEPCPPDCPKPCCCEPCPPDCPKPCCCKPCPPDCPKPCCAKQAEASGCCPAEAATQ